MLSTVDCLCQLSRVGKLKISRVESGEWRVWVSQLQGPPLHIEKLRGIRWTLILLDTLHYRLRADISETKHQN